MTRLISPFIIATLAMMISISCKKNNSTPSNSSNTVTPTFSAKLNGNAWMASSIKTDSNSASVTVDCYAADGSEILMSVPHIFHVGTVFNLDSSNDGAMTYTSKSGDLLINTTGTIMITYYSNEVVKGTFACDLANFHANYNVTNGAFTIKLK